MTRNNILVSFIGTLILFQLLTTSVVVVGQIGPSVKCYMCGGDPNATISNPNALIDLRVLPDLPPDVAIVLCSVIFEKARTAQVVNRSACDAILASPRVVPELQKPCGCSTLSLFTSMPSPFKVPIPASVPTIAKPSPGIPIGAVFGIVIGILLLSLIGFLVMRSNAQQHQSSNDTTTTNADNKIRTRNDTTTAIVSSVSTIQTIPTDPMKAPAHVMNNEILQSYNERVPIAMMDTTNKNSLFVLPNALTGTNITLQHQWSDDNDSMSGITDDITSLASGYTSPTTGRTTISSKSHFDNTPIVNGSIVSSSTSFRGVNTSVLLPNTLLGDYRVYDDDNYNNREDDEKTLFSKTDVSEF